MHNPQANALTKGYWSTFSLVIWLKYQRQKGRSQAGQKGRQLHFGASRFLAFNNLSQTIRLNTLKKIYLQLYLHMLLIAICSNRSGGISFFSSSSLASYSSLSLSNSPKGLLWAKIIFAQQGTPLHRGDFNWLGLIIQSVAQNQPCTYKEEIL